MFGNYTDGDTPVPKYRLTRFLGKGGFGTVWEALGPGKVRVALKVIALSGSGKQGRKEFRAIRMMKNISQAHLVPIYALWLKDQNGDLMDDWLADTGNLALTQAVESDTRRPCELIIAMGLGEKSLFDRLKECQAEGKPGVPVEELLDYMYQSARGIDFLNDPIHDMGEKHKIAIQHCDIKPQNIMLVGGVAQVVDFGLAKPLHQTQVAMTAGVAATLAYAPPELLTKVGPTRGTDQYSLAVSYYELRTGRLPFPEDVTVAEVIEAHTQSKLDFSHVSEREQSILRKATVADASERFESATELVRKLKRALKPRKKQGAGRASRIESGQRLGLGFTAKQLLVQTPTDHIWKAYAPGVGKLMAVALSDVRNRREGVDFEAL
ncbi:MAG: serine/threonine protein kinase, partial [Planctomycetales bacterium]